MRPLRAEDIRGTWGTPLLPIRTDEEIDFERLEREVDQLTESHVDGIYTNGTAGEFHAQTEDEFDRIQDLIAQRCEKAGVPFQIGVSHPSAQTSYARLTRTVGLRPGAFQVILPDWIPVQGDECRRFLARMAEAADPVGIVLYNPPHAKRVLAPEEYEGHATSLPGVIGLKVAGGDADWHRRMRIHAEGLSIFVPGHRLATGYAHGADGSYSNVACLNPRRAAAWYEKMRTDLDPARAVEHRLQAFMDRCIAPFQHLGYSAPALDKLLAAIGGWTDVGTRIRWPYGWIPEAEAERLRPIARQMIPELCPAEAGP